MIKKRIISLIAVVFLMASLFGSAYAASKSTLDTNPNDVSVLRASSYLSTYRVSLTAKPNHRMSIDASIDGTGIMDKIGVSIVQVDQKINGVWSDYETFYAIDNPYFYQYDTVSYLDTISFYGTQGVQYRVTLTVYASKNGGADTGTITSFTTTCN